MLLTINATPDTSTSTLPSHQTPLVPPSKLPYPATTKDIPKLKQYIIEHFASSAFNTDSPFPSMETTPSQIHLKPNAVPYATHIHSYSTTLETRDQGEF